MPLAGRESYYATSRPNGFGEFLLLVEYTPISIIYGSQTPPKQVAQMIQHYSITYQDTQKLGY
jgi:hypothetical protein